VRLGRRSRDPHVVARVDDRLHALRVSHERGRELAEPCVVGSRLLALRIQQPHQNCVEACLALERRRQRVPRAPRERGSEAGGARTRCRRPQLVQLAQQLAGVGRRLAGERGRRLLVELGECLRVRGFLVREPAAERIQLGERLRVGHGGL
jgi:hypothetical protein